LPVFHQTPLGLAKKWANNADTMLSEHNEPDRPSMQTLDRFLIAADTALRTVAGANHATRPTPGSAAPDELVPDLDPESRHLSGALMRVNHVGEVCAQALYSAQALATRDERLRHHFEQAARDETDHLAWTQQRLAELGDRPSLLNPLWYAGAFAIGLVAGRLGDAVSLGFVVETERQVEQHLAGHLDRLPPADTASRRIVTQMMEDEVRHAVDAEGAGAAPLPGPARMAMRAAAKVMTTVAHRI
jgi:3-demethoxyubiquinol 3-hydroxylase